jgi:hypothetical protein
MAAPLLTDVIFLLCVDVPLDSPRDGAAVDLP